MVRGAIDAKEANLFTEHTDISEFHIYIIGLLNIFLLQIHIMNFKSYRFRIYHQHVFLFVQFILLIYLSLSTYKVCLSVLMIYIYQYVSMHSFPYNRPLPTLCPKVTLVILLASVRPFWHVPPLGSDNGKVWSRRAGWSDR